MFSCEIWEILKNTFFSRTPPVTVFVCNWLKLSNTWTPGITSNWHSMKTLFYIKCLFKESNANLSNTLLKIGKRLIGRSLLIKFFWTKGTLLFSLLSCLIADKIYELKKIKCCVRYFWACKNVEEAVIIISWSFQNIYYTKLPFFIPSNILRFSCLYWSFSLINF